MKVTNNVLFSRRNLFYKSCVCLRDKLFSKVYFAQKLAKVAHSQKEKQALTAVIKQKQAVYEKCLKDAV